MTHNLYAFLVGIDHYVSPVRRLKGCVNYIRAVKAYLAKRSVTDVYLPHLGTLLNEEATRQAAIDRNRCKRFGFPCHLIAGIYKYKLQIG